MRPSLRIGTLTVALTMVGVSPAYARQDGQSVPSIGQDTTTCADWNAHIPLNTDEAERMRAWASGYWSGAVRIAALDYPSAPGLVLRPMEIKAEPSYFGTMGRPLISVSVRSWDADGVVAEISRRCLSAPSRLLTDATAEAVTGTLRRPPQRTGVMSSEPAAPPE